MDWAKGPRFEGWIPQCHITLRRTARGHSSLLHFPGSVQSCNGLAKKASLEKKLDSQPEILH